MRTVELVEYVLRLSTGEEILASELDPESVPVLQDPVVVLLADAVLSRCTRAPRWAIEDAKSGFPESLEPLLRTPPAGCLLRMSRPVCAEMKTCVLADRDRCSTVRAGKRGLPGFPLCWTFDVPDSKDAVRASAARDLADSIVLAWRDGRHVLIADG